MNPDNETQTDASPTPSQHWHMISLAAGSIATELSAGGDVTTIRRVLVHELQELHVAGAFPELKQFGGGAWL